MKRFNEHNPRLRLIVGLATVLIVVGGLWALSSIIFPEDNGQITILKADNSPYKIRPDQPGGLQVPNKDKLIFNAVSSEGKTVTVERILPGPEQPLNVGNTPVPAPVAVPQTALTQAALPTPAPIPPTSDNAISAMGRGVDTPNAPVAQLEKSVAAQPIKLPAAFDISKGDPALAAPEPAKEPAKQPVKAKEPVVEPVKETSIKEEPVKEETVEVVDTSGPKSKARIIEDKKADEAPKDDQVDDEPTKSETRASDGKMRFQIGSFFDRASADKGLAQFKTKYAAALRGAALTIVTATINGSKQVFRIQGSVHDANEVCAGIKAKGGSCVIIRP